MNSLALMFAAGAAAIPAAAHGFDSPKEPGNIAYLKFGRCRIANEGVRDCQ